MLKVYSKLKKLVRNNHTVQNYGQFHDLRCNGIVQMFGIDGLLKKRENVSFSISHPLASNEKNNFFIDVPRVFNCPRNDNLYQQVHIWEYAR